MRRKTIVNNLSGVYGKENVNNVLNILGFSLTVRPEEISLEQYLKLFGEFNK